MGPPSEFIFYTDYMEGIEHDIGNLVDEICESKGKVPDREIDKMMRELIDLNSLYNAKRLRRKKSKRRKPRVYSPRYRT